MFSTEAETKIVRNSAKSRKSLALLLVFPVTNQVWNVLGVDDHRCSRCGHDVLDIKDVHVHGCPRCPGSLSRCVNFFKLLYSSNTSDSSLSSRSSRPGVPGVPGVPQEFLEFQEFHMEFQEFQWGSRVPGVPRV